MKIAFIGAGAMGGAMAEGFVKSGLFCCLTHPVLSLDSLGQRNLQVLDKCLHTLF